MASKTDSGTAVTPVRDAQPLAAARARWPNHHTNCMCAFEWQERGRQNQRAASIRPLALIVKKFPPEIPQSAHHRIDTFSTDVASDASVEHRARDGYATRNPPSAGSAVGRALSPWAYISAVRDERGQR